MIRYEPRPTFYGGYEQQSSNDIILRFYTTENAVVVQTIGNNGKGYAKHCISLAGCLRQQVEARLKKLVPRFRLQEEFVRFRKDLRRRLYTPAVKSWDEVLPKNIADWFHDYIWDVVKEMNEHCVDNLRVANVRSTAQKRRYRRQQKSGCCGFWDSVVECPIDNQKYFVGFNYGH